jgi:hypothetical protein
VKESRTYPKKGRSRHQIKKEKIEAADVFVFVTYVPARRGERLEFETQFIVIPGNDLREMCNLKNTSKGKYSFYFIKRDNGVWEERETGEPRDVTKYFGAWNLI